jgi:hypothetical protein
VRLPTAATVGGDRLVQRFPIYRDDDENAAPTREVHYRLDASEAGWLLRVDRIVEF